MKFTKKVVLIAVIVAVIAGASGKANASALPSSQTVEAGASVVSIWANSARVVVGGSGAAVMKGLANGAIIGKGVAAGAATTGLISGIGGATLINNTLLRDDGNLSEGERNARSAGRAGSYAGAAIGAAVTYGAISAAGSAAGISSTLTAIGGTICGGMALGAVTVVAAPAAIAMAAGVTVYGIVKLVDWAWN